MAVVFDGLEGAIDLGSLEKNVKLKLFGNSRVTYGLSGLSFLLEAIFFVLTESTSQGNESV